MASPSPNLRKAAVLIRSLDAETGASLLAQLSPDEAAALRAAIRALGPIDPEERADVVAEFRRARPLLMEPAAVGVELRLTSSETYDGSDAELQQQPVAATVKRFEFLERAPIEVLVPYLAREHVQTIAVVLSYLPAGRAAAVVAALPEKIQADTMERLATLGETDPQSLIVLEHELAAWLAKRAIGRPGSVRRHDAVACILAAADATTRQKILANLKTHKAELADELAPAAARDAAPRRNSKASRRRPAISAPRAEADDLRLAAKRMSHDRAVSPAPPRPSLPPLAPFDFDHLIQLDAQTLGAVLRNVDANVLLIALVGSRDDLIDRICDQMPNRMARSFRKQLRRIGPTRLADVEAAQQSVARAAAQQLSHQRTRALTPIA